MSDPTWLQAIKDAFLADEASVFLLHGPGTSAQWTLDGTTDDFVDILVGFLARSREVVGLLAPPGALRFPGIGDVGRFERLLSAAYLVAGKHHALHDDIPEEALGKLWVALSDAETPQGYVVGHVDAIYPGHRKRVVDLGAKAPPLWEWCTAPRIRGANHIVLLVTHDLEAVRPELAEAAKIIRVPAPAQPTSNEPAPAPEQTVPAPSPAPEPPPVESPPPAQPAPAAPKAVDDEALAGLVDALNSAIRGALATQGEEMRPAKVPVMAGVAVILGERTGSPGALEWSLDEDGRAVATGDGADDFLALWRGDIALDASAGMLLGKLAGEIPARLDETGLRALGKRLLKKHL